MTHGQEKYTDDNAFLQNVSKSIWTKDKEAWFDISSAERDTGNDVIVTKNKSDNTTFPAAWKLDVRFRAPVSGCCLDSWSLEWKPATCKTWSWSFQLIAIIGALKIENHEAVAAAITACSILESDVLETNISVLCMFPVTDCMSCKSHRLF